MATSVTRGQVKYVFTQATAPTGVGEVEGSLWYDTSVNVLNTYTGATWVPVGTTTGITSAAVSVGTGNFTTNSNSAVDVTNPATCNIGGLSAGATYTIIAMANINQENSGVNVDYYGLNIDGTDYGWTKNRDDVATANYACNIVSMKAGLTGKTSYDVKLRMFVSGGTGGVMYSAGYQVTHLIVIAIRTA